VVSVPWPGHLEAERAARQRQARLYAMSFLSIGQVLPGWSHDDDDEVDSDDGPLTELEEDTVGEVCVVEFDHQAASLSELSVRAGDLLFAVVPSEFEQRHGRHAFVEVSTIPICEPLTLLSACCGSATKRNPRQRGSSSTRSCRIHTYPTLATAHAVCHSSQHAIT
jgi:hypothetical protein